MFDRLKTELWASALIRRAEGGGAFASVLHKGDLDSGVALVKVRLLNGTAVLYRPIIDMSGPEMRGTRKWLPKGPVAEDEIDGLISKRLDNDPDLWVIEIDDRKGRHFLTEAIDGTNDGR